MKPTPLLCITIALSVLIVACAPAPTATPATSASVPTALATTAPTAIPVPTRPATPQSTLAGTLTPVVRPTATPVRAPTFTPIPTKPPDPCQKQDFENQSLKRLQVALAKFALGDQKFFFERGQCVLDGSGAVQVWFEPLDKLPDDLILKAIKSAKAGDALVGGMLFFPKHHLMQHGSGPNVEAFNTGAAYVVAALVDNNAQLSTDKISLIGETAREEAAIAGRLLNAVRQPQPGCPCLALAGAFPALRIQLALDSVRYDGALLTSEEATITRNAYDQALSTPKAKDDLTRLDDLLRRSGLIVEGSITQMVDLDRAAGLARLNVRVPGKLSDFRALGAPARTDKASISKNKNQMLAGLLMFPQPGGNEMLVSALVFKVGGDRNQNDILDFGDSFGVVLITPDEKQISYDTIVRPANASTSAPALQFEAGSCVVYITWDQMRISLPSIEPFCQ